MDAIERRGRSTLREIPWWVAPLVIALVGVAGCRRSAVPRHDGSSDDGGEPGLDTDQDGLCDPGEVTRGLRVDDPDTDMDGFSDLMEVSLGFDGTSALSPVREGIIYLEETEGTHLVVPVPFPVESMGYSFTGGFNPLGQAFGDGTDASQFFAGTSAAFANPMQNVGRIDGQTFAGVIGRTLLTFNLELEYRGGSRGCMRAYPFSYLLKRDDGRIVDQMRFTLVIRPSGDDHPWCAAMPCF